MSTEKLYVVIKRGLFWRPEDKGYTAKIEEAGRYTKEEAESRCHGGEQPVTMALESEFQTTESIKAENSQLRTDLEAALKTASFRFDEWSKGQTELENSESRCAALAAECESLRADKARRLFSDTARTLQCFTLCPKCNKESEIPMGITNHEMNSNSHACPHCKTVIQTWVRVAARADAARKEPPAKAHGCEVGE